MTGKLWSVLIVGVVLLAALVWIPRGEWGAPGTQEEAPVAAIPDVTAPTGEPTMSDTEASDTELVTYAGLRDPERIDESIERGWIDARYRDLWLSLPGDDPLAEVKMMQTFRVLPEFRSEPCEPLRGDLNICWNHFAYHPYLAYEKDTLRSMAETDPVAAAALAVVLDGNRSDAPERLYYALRAAEMSGKGGPLYRYVEKSQWQLSDQTRDMERYVVHLAADSFDTPFYRSRPAEERLMRNYNMTQEELRQFAREIFDEMQAEAEAAAADRRP